MKPRYAIISVVIIVALAMVIYSQKPARPTDEDIDNLVAGMGISHYDLSNVTVNSETTVTVARVTNTGDISLYVNVSWTSENTDLNVQIIPETTMLYSEESVKIKAVFYTDVPGVYQGTFNISGSKISRSDGNQIVSGGSVDATVTAV